MAASTRGGSRQFLRIERRCAGQEFVKQHAEAVNVRARVDVQPAHLGLFGTHVGGCPDELMQVGVDGRVGQAPFDGLGDAEIDDLLKNAGDVRVIHSRQRLALRLEPRQD
jgi:hypothetical protein